MEQKHPIVSELVERTKSYGKTTLELIKLRSIDKGSDVVALIVAIIIIATLLVFMIVMLNIGLALWVGYLLGESYLGFFAVGGCYALLALIIFLLRKPAIINPVKNNLVNHLYKESDHEQE